MKIVAPGGPDRRVGRTQKSGPAASGDFSEKLAGARETKSSEASAGVSPLRSLDALLTIQAETQGHDVDERESRRGHALLDELETIRTGLLTGSLPRGRLEALARMLDQHQERAVSPRLAQVISDIELRVKVELAKFSSI